MKEALKLALEALEELNNTNSYWWQEVDEETVKKIKPAITAIKEALANHIEDNLAMVAQPEQEPVACVAEVSTYDGYLRKEVVWNKRIDSFSLGTRFYTTPPQRTWVGLTDEEFAEACQMAERGNYLVAFQRIQAKLKEKNT